MRKAIGVKSNVKSLDNHRIRLKFGDRTQGETDWSDRAGQGVSAAWTHRKVFDEVRVDASDTVVWVGEIGPYPDALYPRLMGKAVVTHEKRVCG